jgi:hypothetical protein
MNSTPSPMNTLPPMVTPAPGLKKLWGTLHMEGISEDLRVSIRRSFQLPTSSPPIMTPSAIHMGRTGGPVGDGPRALPAAERRARRFELQLKGLHHVRHLRTV